MNIHYRKTLLIASLIVCGNAYSEMYKWVDDEGNVQYSQQKPSGDFEVIKPPPKIKKTPVDEPVSNDGGPIIVDSEEELKRLEEMGNKAIAEQKEIDEKNKKIAEENEKNKKANCEKSKELLNRLISLERVKVKGDDGVVRWASVEQKQEQVDKANANVSQWCN